MADLSKFKKKAEEKRRETDFTKKNSGGEAKGKKIEDESNNGSEVGEESNNTLVKDKKRSKSLVKKKRTKKDIARILSNNLGEDQMLYELSAGFLEKYREGKKIDDNYTSCNVGKKRQNFLKDLSTFYGITNIETINTIIDMFKEDVWETFKKQKLKKLTEGTDY